MKVVQKLTEWETKKTNPARGSSAGKEQGEKKKDLKDKDEGK